MKYEIVVKATHELFDRATEFMHEIGYTDIKGLSVEVIVGYITAEEKLTEDDLREIREVMLKKKDSFEKLIGMQVLDIKLRPTH